MSELPDIKGEDVIKLIGWFDYEHNLLDGFPDEMTIESLCGDNKLYGGYLGKILKQMGFETIKDYRMDDRK